ncbi:MAG TPA: hypothetical protein VM260_15360, partial [Pirellula sp.]|nr:hypothetical protein [Pirellula sp.]
DMTVDEFRATVGSIKSLDHTGREQETIEIAAKKIDWKELKTDIMISLEKLDIVGVKRGKDWIAKLDAMMLRPERLISDLDSRDPLGPLTQAVMRPIQDSKFRENELLDGLTNKLKDLRGTREWRKSQTDRIEQDVLIDPATDAPYIMQRSDLMNVMLNFGNRSNIDKFIIPYARVANKDPLVLEQEIRALITKNATPADWKYVQGVWDIFKDLKVESDKMYRELSGVAPETIRAEPIDGNAGGYMPIVYDANRSGINIQKNSGYLEDNYYRATTPAGYTKRRTGYQDYVQVINTHENIVGKMQQMIHDIAFRRSVLSTAQIIDDRQIAGEIRKRYGAEYLNQLQFWLKDVANISNVNDPAVGFMNDVARRFRTNLVVQALGFNTQVLLSPDMGAFISVGNLSTFSRMIRGNMRSEMQLAVDKSKELQQMSVNYDRDFREQYIKLIGARSGLDAFQMEAAKWAMSVTMSTSHMFRAITFLTEYRKALSEEVL